jgi:hypothetical protein
MPATEGGPRLVTEGDVPIPPVLPTLQVDGVMDIVGARRAALKHVWHMRHNLEGVS